MKYVALLRGINSGNVRFESSETVSKTLVSLDACFQSELGFTISTLVKSLEDMKRIAAAIPIHWENDAEQRTDVAYLFNEIDTIDTINKLPMNIDFVDLIYSEGAIIWNIKRENYNKSRLNKLIGHKLYQYMTVRNVNTARRMSED